jgi:hypothetical protein
MNPAFGYGWIDISVPIRDRMERRPDVVVG